MGRTLGRLTLCETATDQELLDCSHSHGCGPTSAAAPPPPPPPRRAGGRGGGGGAVALLRVDPTRSSETGTVRGLRWHNLPRERKGVWGGEDGPGRGTGRAQGDERPTDTTAHGGGGSKGRTVRGDRPIGAASRREHTKVSYQPLPPPRPHRPGARLHNTHPSPPPPCPVTTTPMITGGRPSGPLFPPAGHQARGGQALLPVPAHDPPARPTAVPAHVLPPVPQGHPLRPPWAARSPGVCAPLCRFALSPGACTRWAARRVLLGVGGGRVGASISNSRPHRTATVPRGATSRLRQSTHPVP